MFSRVAVCQARDVPPFGPVIRDGQIYEHGLEFANLLLEKGKFNCVSAQ